MFNCAARFGDTSLKDQLFQGPDLTNNLTGVLLRFRQEPVALMSDEEEEEEPLLIYNAQGSPFRCKKLSVINGSPEHNKADTRLLIHTADAARRGYTKEMVRTIDTDVAVIAVAKFQCISLSDFLIQALDGVWCWQTPEKFASI